MLKKYGVELIGAKLEAIRKAEDRQLFKDCMVRGQGRENGWCGCVGQLRFFCAEWGVLMGARPRLVNACSSKHLFKTPF